LNPRARVVAGANAGVSPEIMGIGPVPATRKVLERTGWSVDDLAAVELNEAFASQSLACIRHRGLDPDPVHGLGGTLALRHPAHLNEVSASHSLACIGDLVLAPDTVNGFGGAIALGHPLGCSGTRITLTLLNRLEQAEAKKGLATMCVGVGQGSALLLERA